MQADLGKYDGWYGGPLHYFELGTILLMHVDYLSFIVILTSFSFSLVFLHLGLILI